MDLKKSFYQSVTYFCQGTDSHEKEKHGDAVCYLEAAKEHLEQAAKLAKVKHIYQLN